MVVLDFTFRVAQDIKKMRKVTSRWKRRKGGDGRAGKEEMEEEGKRRYKRRKRGRKYDMKAEGKNMREEEKRKWKRRKRGGIDGDCDARYRREETPPNLWIS